MWTTPSTTTTLSIPTTPLTPSTPTTPFTPFTLTTQTNPSTPNTLTNPTTPTPHPQDAWSAVWALCVLEVFAILSSVQSWALCTYEFCVILSSVCYRKPVVSKTHFTCSIPNLIFLVFLGVPHQRFDPTGCDQRFPRSERGSRATVAPPVDADWNHSGLGGGHQRTQQKHHHFLRGQRLTRQVKMSILV